MEKKEKSWLAIASLFLTLLAIVIAIIFFLNGNTNTTNSPAEANSTETITCEGKNINYPFFDYINTEDKSLKTVSIFNNEVLDSISLIYQLKYSNTGDAEKSDSENQAAMNISFGNDDLKAYAFNAKYSNINNTFQMTLYAKSDDLNSNTLKYFMLDNLRNGQHTTRNDIIKAYSDRGLTCNNKESNDKENNNEK